MTNRHHCGLKPQDDLIHQDYPKNDPTPWKENWAFAWFDKGRKTLGFYHVSLEREIKRARFTRTHWVEGKELFDEQIYLDIDENFTELTHPGGVRIEFVEPLEKIQITDKGPGYQMDMTFHARFEAFNYEGFYDEDERMKETKTMEIKHYEQPMRVEGTLVKDGETITIDGFGYRDHSWGYREDNKMDSHQWIWAHFDDKLIHGVVLTAGDIRMSTGYIASDDGFEIVTDVQTEATGYVEETGRPHGARHRITTADGNTFTLLANCVKNISIAWPDPPRSVSDKGQYWLYENYSDFEIEETGEKGFGGDEHGRTIEPRTYSTISWNGEPGSADDINN